MKRGFTLVETVIYVALAVLVLGLIIELALAGSRSFARAREERAVTMDAVSALERLVREIRLAQSFNPAGSVFGSDSGRLVLSQSEFYLAEGSLWIKEGAQESPLTSAKTEITSLVFEPLTDPKSQAIRIKLTLRARTGSGADYNFKTTAVLRSFYVDEQ